jgi:hypothetical protein
MPAQHIDYALWYKGYQILSRELELAIPLVASYQHNYSDTTLRGVKKAIKSGIVVTPEGSINDFWKILTLNLEKKHHVKPVHDIHDIQMLIKCVGQEKVKLFAALYEGRTIAGILVFLANKKVVHAQYIASDEDFQAMRPLNLVIDQIVEWSFREGYSFVNLGSCNEKGGTIINEGLARFKEGFGATGILRETMQLTINT